MTVTPVLNELFSLLDSPKIERLPVASDGRPGSADILRLDLIDPQLSGNKLYKCLDHIAPWLESGCSAWVTPGGVYSNHLHAVAALAKQLGITSHGLVRGYADQPLTPTLTDCQAWGMQLHFLNKKEYRNRYQLAFQNQWSSRLNAYWIGEGGGMMSERAELPRLGMRALARLCEGYDQVWLAVGSGTTAEGIRPYLVKKTCLIGVNAVADQGALRRRWSEGWGLDTDWTLIETGSLGSFAKFPPPLANLVRHYDGHQLPLDPVYTARLLWAWESFGHTLAGRGQKCLLIHGGGLQGRRGYFKTD